MYMRDHADHRLDAHARQPAQSTDQLARLGAILVHVEGKHTGLLNRVVIPALGLTMLAQDLQLPRQFRSRAQIAGIGIACDQAQGLLAPPTDQDRRMWSGEALREVEQAFEPVVLSLSDTSAL